MCRGLSKYSCEGYHREVRNILGGVLTLQLLNSPSLRKMSFHKFAWKSDSYFTTSFNRRELDKHSFEYKDAIKHASSSMRSNVSRVEKVDCPTLYGWFLARKAEYESRGYKNAVKTLVHVTGACNIDSILRKNLDWRRVRRGRFGNGVSFADDAAYANRYAAREIGSSRAMIVAEVLVGEQTNGMSVYEIPKNGVDTATGNGHVYVKFYDDEFYPKYIVYYRL